MRLQKFGENIQRGEDQKHRQSGFSEPVEGQKSDGENKAFRGGDREYGGCEYQHRRHGTYAVIRHRTHSVKPKHIRQIIRGGVNERALCHAETAITVKRHRRYHRNERNEREQVERFKRERRAHQKPRQRGRGERLPCGSFLFYPSVFLHPELPPSFLITIITLFSAFVNIGRRCLHTIE